MLDLIIRGGSVLDGTGSVAVTADVGVRDGVIVEFGRLAGTAKEVIEADGLLVTPGFVDVHTHYDGQITWDDIVSPSCWHGVTTMVMGNCGVGFAPVRRGREDWLVGLMEGVEDIPGAALHEGIRWDWESFPEYLRSLAGLRRTMDFGAQIPYACVRAYVMDERSIDQPATAHDVELLTELVAAGLDAGALGLTMNRMPLHRAVDGSMVPGTNAGIDEVIAVGSVLGTAGRGVLQLAPAGGGGEDLEAPEREFAWMRRLARATGRPVTFALVQNNAGPQAWRDMLDLSAAARAEGIPVYPQVHGRSPMILMGLEAKLNPLRLCPSYDPIKDLPVGEQARRITHDAALREALIPELEVTRLGWTGRSIIFENMFALGLERPCYEPPASESIASLAGASGRRECDVLLELLTMGKGTGLIAVPILNYNERTLDPVHDMLAHPATILGLADGGAHCNAMCDAGVPTYMLEYWARDRNHGRIPVEQVVKMMTSETAALYGMTDRGTITPGLRADLNVIDFERVRQHVPRLVRDLPGNASRFIQESSGFAATIVRGEVTFRNGEHTGALPGRLLRSAASHR